MKFLNIKSDFAFKKVFAEIGSKHRLLSLLNALFPQDNNNAFTDLTLDDPYNLPALFNLKETWVDIKVTLNDGTKVLIEMQVISQHDFNNRVFYNGVKSYGNQLVTGEQYGRLKARYAVTITDFILFAADPNVVNHYQMRNDSTIMPYNDQFKMAFIELPKFDKSQNECLHRP